MTRYELMLAFRLTAATVRWTSPRIDWSCLAGMRLLVVIILQIQW